MQIKVVNLLITLLHSSHRQSLELILEMLTKIVENSKYNNMNLDSVCTVWAPVFVCKSFDPSSDSKKSSSTLNLSQLNESNDSGISGHDQQLNNLFQMTELIKRQTETLMNLVRLLIILKPIIFHVSSFEAKNCQLTP